MKLLRILTGVHAGAELRLSPGTHRIGPDDDADIRISDWRGADVLLAVDADGVVSARRVVAETADAAEAVEVEGGAAGASAGETGRFETGGTRGANPASNLAADPATGATLADASSPIDPGTVLLVDFVPMQFGETVLCVGWSDAAWPSDLDLLSTLLIKPSEERREAERSRRRKIAGIALACAMLGAVIVIGSVLMTTMVSRAALPHDAGGLAQRVNDTLAAAHQNELRAHAEGNTVLVTGMVATPEDDVAVRRLLSRFSQTSIYRRYDVAQNDVHSIEDSLGVRGARVAYAGNGAFDVTGSVSNPADLDAAIARVRHDLSENVRAIRSHVTQSTENQPLPPSFSMLMTSDTVRYAETPDGVKHIYAQPDPPDAASDTAAASADGAGGAPGAAAAQANSASGVPPTVTTGAATGVMEPAPGPDAASGAAAAGSGAAAAASNTTSNTTSTTAPNTASHAALSAASNSASSTAAASRPTPHTP
ncbi:type III secretion protein D [Paraburkholderia kururiensis]|uniref:secretion protein n=1 Tax=Paraburkholderia kururiensis TaxID=984307 RepID=UPI0039A68800